MPGPTAHSKSISPATASAAVTRRWPHGSCMAWCRTGCCWTLIWRRWSPRRLQSCSRSCSIFCASARIRSCFWTRSPSPPPSMRPSNRRRPMPTSAPPGWSTARCARSRGRRTRSPRRRTSRQNIPIPSRSSTACARPWTKKRSRPSLPLTTTSRRPPCSVTP